MLLKIKNLEKNSTVGIVKSERWASNQIKKMIRFENICAPWLKAQVRRALSGGSVGTATPSPRRGLR